MQVSNNFILQEFIPKEIHDVWGNNSMQFLDFRIIRFAQLLRENLERPLIVNNWHKGGKYNESGLRAFLSKTGARMSQHKYGRAVDIKVLDFYGKVEKNGGRVLRQHVMDNYEIYKDLITTTEADTDSWAHFDCRYTGLENLLIVPNPNILK